MWRNRLVKNQARLAAWRKREAVTCFRAYDRDIPELPFQVDVYEGEGNVTAAVVVAFAPRHGGGAAFDAFCVACRDVVASVFGAAHVFLQLRERERGGEVEAEDADASTVELVVRERAARFLLRLGARRDPGLFLDHRPTRLLVADQARGKDVLNLFAYTGSFSVHAALAGASSTTSVDLSPKTTRWAEENLALNGLSGGVSGGLSGSKHRAVCQDVLAFVDSHEGDASFDIAVVDPPSFSRSKRATRTFEVQRDHPELVRATLRKCRAGGVVWFSTNFRGFALDPALLNDRALVIDDVTTSTTPPDFAQTAHRCFRIRRA